MSMSPDPATAFKEIYQELFGIELSDDECREKAQKLAALYKTIYKSN